MNEEQKQAFEEQLNALPETYQEVVRSYPWEERVISIGTGQKLYLDQVDDLAAEVALALVGITEPDDMKNELIDRLLIDATKAESLVRALNLEIFTPIQEIMQQKTSAVAPQFEGKNDAAADSPKPGAVFKIAPEKYSLQNEKKEKNTDPYREPIE